MKSSEIGGQAVLEGVMMRNKDTYAVAVRKPDKEIVVEKCTYISIKTKYKILGFPIIRGIVSFIESMIIGMKTLTFSSSFFEEETNPRKIEKKKNKLGKEKTESIMMAVTIIASIAMAIGIFMIFPFLIANIIRKQIGSNAILAMIEGLIRIGIFICYIWLISRIEDIKRVFMYHGAEHKTINCIENGFELTVENVKRQSKEHRRCGTSFMLIVMVISILFFIFIQVDTLWLRILIRILLVPIIAGVSFEFIKLAGRSNSKFVILLSRPGMWLQGLTTREPDDEMIQVAIQSVEAVFDWKAYLEEGKNEKDII